MSKVEIETIENLQVESSAIGKINGNFERIQAQIDLLLSRDGEAPNTMLDDLDMNNKRILNLPDPIDDREPALHGSLNQYVAGAEAAQEAAEEAQAATEGLKEDVEGLKEDVEQIKSDVEDIEDNVEIIQTNIENLSKDFNEKYLGPFASDVDADNYVIAEGLTKQAGTLYFNTVSSIFRFWDGAAWDDWTVSLADGSVTTPKLDDEAVTTDKIADEAITADKIEPAFLDLILNSGGDVYDFATAADAAAATPDTPMTHFRIAGWTTVGDRGGGLFKAVVSEPVSGPKIEVDGTWYAWAEDYITPEACGYHDAVDDVGRGAAMQAAADYAGDTGVPVLLGAKTYWLDPALGWRLPDWITIRGTSGELTAIRYQGSSAAVRTEKAVGSGAPRAYGISMFDLAIEGYFNNDQVTGSIGFDCRNISKARLVRVRIYGFDTGVQCFGDDTAACYYNLFDSCEVGHMKTEGYLLATNANAIWIRTGRVVDCPVGIRAYDCSQNWVDAVAIETCPDTHIKVQAGCWDLTIRNCRIETPDGVSLGTVGISVASTAVRTIIYDPQYTTLATNLSNSSTTTKVNGRYLYTYTIDRGSIAANSTDEHLVSVSTSGSSMTSGSTGGVITVSPSISSGLLGPQFVPTVNGFYSRLGNITTSAIDPGNWTHNCYWWKNDGM